jgi:hypothetical protein
MGNPSLARAAGTEAALNSLSTLEAPQHGHAGCSAARTKSSNSCWQFVQRYSNNGIRGAPGNR